MTFYLQHFLHWRDGFIIRLEYTQKHQMHSREVPLCHFKVSLHRLWVNINHKIPSSKMDCKICHLHEAQSKDHLIFPCPTCYEIKGMFYYLNIDLRDLPHYFLQVRGLQLPSYIPQRCTISQEKNFTQPSQVHTFQFHRV